MVSHQLNGAVFRHTGNSFLHSTKVARHNPFPLQGMTEHEQDNESSSWGAGGPPPQRQLAANRAPDMMRVGTMVVPGRKIKKAASRAHIRPSRRDYGLALALAQAD